MAAVVSSTRPMREFGLWHVDGDDLLNYFPEMRPFAGECRFRMKCRHEREPGCAITAAFAGGAISEHRYRSYLRIRS